MNKTLLALLAVLLADAGALAHEGYRPIGDNGLSIDDVGTDDARAAASGRPPEDGDGADAEVQTLRQLQGLPAESTGLYEGAYGVVLRFNAGAVPSRDKLALLFNGGDARFAGRPELPGATAPEGAVSFGTSMLEPDEDGELAKPGTPASGSVHGAAMIDADFRQSPSERLPTRFDVIGARYVLGVRGTLSMSGTLELNPTKDWYPSGWSRLVDEYEDGDFLEGEGIFHSVVVTSISPTLDFHAEREGDGQLFRLFASRTDDAYSRYGANANERAAGRALQRLAGQAPADIWPFFEALDFSVDDGSDVGRVLGEVTPHGYSASLAASLMRERDVMDAAMRGQNEGMRVAGTQWRGFATLFGSEGWQDGRGSVVGYRASIYGLVVGGARRLASEPDVAVGLHLDIADQSIRIRPARAGGDATAFGVGVLASYRPESTAGVHAEGGVRFGIEQGDMRRDVDIGDYHASHKADWTGHGVSFQAGGGYRWPMDAGPAIGPFASLNYARVSRPGINESGPVATRLSLDGQRVDALRASIGIDAVAPLVLDDGGRLNAQVRLSWDREWLDRDVAQTARFSAARAVSFRTVNAVLPGDSMSLRAGFSWQRGERFSLGAGLGGRVGGGYKSFDGQLSMRWAF